MLPSSDADLPLVVFTRCVPVAGKEIGSPPQISGARVIMAGSEQASPDQLREMVRGTSVIVSMFHDRVDAALLDAAGPRLRGVCNFAVGYDNIDVAACKARGVMVANCPDAVTEGTANMAWGLILACSRRIVSADRYIRAGGYARDGIPGIVDWLGMHLTGQTLLIVGAGRIGMAVALRALAFGMRVLYVARSRHVGFELAPIAARRVELEEGLALADIVSLHTPLSPQTRHLIDRRRLDLMKPTAILVNTARGPVVDEAALAEALEQRRIYAAGLDVFEDEPRVSAALLGLDNVVMTPHIGSAERYWREVMTQIVCVNVQAMLAGNEPPNRVG